MQEGNSSDNTMPLTVIHSFLDYLKKLQNKFHKVMLFLDKASTFPLNQGQKTFGREQNEYES